MKYPFTAILLLSLQICFAHSVPSVVFTQIPGWGGSSLLMGRIHKAAPAGHGVAVYIFAEEAGGWWNKPLASNPVTPVFPDSSFQTDIVTAGIDQFATKIIAFLVPLTYAPPILPGGDLPAGLFSFPYAVASRPHGDRVIAWSGWEWTVKRSVGNNLAIGPGPNLFSDQDSMVWVDGQQRLHLRIAKHDQAWHCTEIIGKASLGYGRYNFDASSRVDLLDRNMIAGIFTWDDCAPFAQPPDDSFREIDIEFSEWGNPENKNAQFVIQPYDNSAKINRFDLDLSGTDHSTHFFDWSPDSISFNSTWGSNTHSWKYADPTHIPIPGNENVRINFHLLNGSPPSDGMNGEFILNSFVTGVEAVQFGKESVQIFPNPMIQGCVVEIYMSQFKDVEIGILDLPGNLIRNIFHGTLMTGQNRIVWDGKNADGQPVQPGIYLFFLRSGAETIYRKIIKM